MKRPNNRLLQLLFILLAFTYLSFLLHLITKTKPKSKFHQKNQNASPTFLHPPLKVYVANLPHTFNYGLLSNFYSLYGPDNRLGTNPDANRFLSFFHRFFKTYLSLPPYPENPLIKPHSAEYWLLKDLEMNDKNPEGAPAVRVRNFDEADIICVPFFASLSAEMELGWGQKGKFKKKNAEKNGDYRRQREVMDRIKASPAWQRSGGRDHVFVMSVDRQYPNGCRIIVSWKEDQYSLGNDNSIVNNLDPVAMWHVRSEIAPAILLVEDFGGWYQTDIKATASEDACNSTYIIQHTEASFLKDVIVPYNHLLPRLDISQIQPRHNLLYFKGTKHRHRGGSIREKLWKLLENEPGVKIEEGSLRVCSRLQTTEAKENNKGRERERRGKEGTKQVLVTCFSRRPKRKEGTTRHSSKSTAPALFPRLHPDLESNEIATVEGKTKPRFRSFLPLTTTLEQVTIVGFLPFPFPSFRFRALEHTLNATGLEEAKHGMRDSEFCLHPAGDTPTSCRLFDAIASLCIPVIVSDQIELPFEGIVDYTEFAVFVSVKNALTSNWLLEHLRGFSEEQKEIFRANLAGVQSYFEYGGDSGSSGGAVNLIWEMIYQKLPMIRQAVVGDRRKPDDRETKSVTCLCT